MRAARSRRRHRHGRWLKFLEYIMTLVGWRQGRRINGWTGLCRRLWVTRSRDGETKLDRFCFIIMSYIVRRRVDASHRRDTVKTQAC